MRYLVATDSSAESDEAVRYATRHAAAFDAALEIVHVVTPEAEVVGEDLVVEAHESAAQAGFQTLEEAVELAATTAPEAALDVETELLTGRPADAITDHARTADADAIFVGHRGLSARQEAVVGSVAKSIIDKADVPVTVVR